MAMVLLGWNEKTTVCNSNAILYSQQQAQTVSCSSAANSGTIAFVMCDLVGLPIWQVESFNNQMASGAFGTALTIASASVTQLAEQYLCVESKTTQTTTSTNSANQQVKTTVTTYSYATQWSSSWVQSSSFAQTVQALQARAAACPSLDAKGGNPPWPSNVIQGTQTFYAQSINAGAYTIPQNLLTPSWGTGLAPNQAVALGNFTANFQPLSSMTYNFVTSPAPPTSMSVTNMAVNSIGGNYLVICQTPSIGCFRLSYKMNGNTAVASLGAISSGGTMTAMDIPSYWGCSATTFFALSGQTRSTISLNDMVNDLHSVNAAWSWVIRIVGLIFAWTAVYCCLGPLTAATQLCGDTLGCIPCVGGYLEAIFDGVMEIIICTIACTSGCACGLFVIGIIWVGMRPVVGGPILAAACVMFCGAFCWLHTHKKAFHKKTAEAEAEGGAAPTQGQS